jgi:multidrug efflux pump subunit AcrA (membrane-fusion protein)
MQIPQQDPFHSITQRIGDPFIKLLQREFAGCRFDVSAGIICRRKRLFFADRRAATRKYNEDCQTQTGNTAYKPVHPSILSRVEVTPAAKARLRFADGTAYQQEGTINFVDVQVDRNTDTILVRATFPNPAGALVDGQFVRIEVEREKPEEKVVIPQAALIADQEGVYVFAVEDGKAAVKRVKPGSATDTGVVIDQGLTADELVIVDGLLLVRPGIEVRATPSRTLSGG